MASKDFFLSPDDAQTMGDINYMRRSVRVRHTFPKNLKNPNGFEIVKEVSSSQDLNLNSNRSFSTSSSTTSTTSSSNSTKQTTASNSTGSFATKAVDTSMDLFRNMARNIGKR